MRMMQEAQMGDQRNYYKPRTEEEKRHSGNAYLSFFFPFGSLFVVIIYERSVKIKLLPETFVSRS